LADRTALRRLKKDMQDLLNLLAGPPAKGFAKGAAHPIRGAKTLCAAAPKAPGSDDLFI
jgi:hypothetical protein